jgi:hypothetical protein
MLPQQVNIRSEASTSGMVQQVSQIFASLEFVEAKLAYQSIPESVTVHDGDY